MAKNSKYFFQNLEYNGVDNIHFTHGQWGYKRKPNFHSPRSSPPDFDLSMIYSCIEESKDLYPINVQFLCYQLNKFNFIY